MSQEGIRSDSTSVTPWDPKRFLRRIDALEARFSRGFLRSRPEKWFPGFGAQWLPLAHSLGVEFRIVEVKPVLVLPKGLDIAFAGSVDAEPLGMFMDEESARGLLDAVCPGAADASRSVVLEYLARRFLGSIALSWSGAESSTVRFDEEGRPFEINEAGVVKFTVSVNSHHCTVWLALGPALVGRLDGLWRRQVHSSSKHGQNDLDLHIEVGQLAVPPSMLADYMKPGTVIDLEVLLTDQVTLRLAGRPWMPGRLCDIDGNFGIEVIAGPVPSPALPEGTTRLAIELGALSLDATSVAEMSQIGAIWPTNIPLGSQVAMVINGDTIGNATLCSYEGRFAISVG